MMVQQPMVPAGLTTSQFNRGGIVADPYGLGGYGTDGTQAFAVPAASDPTWNPYGSGGVLPRIEAPAQSVQYAAPVTYAAPPQSVQYAAPAAAPYVAPEPTVQYTAPAATTYAAPA